MNRSYHITILLLLGLTFLTALLSENFTHQKYLVFTIILISVFKFLAVAFQFMEMKHAHKMWKTLIIGFLTLFIGGIGLAL